jgi:aminoglycoside phosphotransferase (APT) family kinase protein
MKRSLRHDRDIRIWVRVDFDELAETVPMSHPDTGVLAWTSAILGGEITVERGLREGGSPWLVRGRSASAVLRVVPLDRPRGAENVATEVAAMRQAAKAGLPVPEVLGHDDGTATGFALALTTLLPGSSHIPARPDTGRLRATGAIAARISAVAPGPGAALPGRSGPIEDFPWARLRHERGASAILMQAEAAVADATPEDTRTGLTHGDLWYGNTLWDDSGDLTAVLDWDAAGTGSPGIDLGSVRLDAALCYGQDAAAEILAGWQDEAGRPAPDLPYWDLVAALATPPDMTWVAPTIADQGRPDLTGDLLNKRREMFLRAALAGHQGRASTAA